MLQYDHPAGAVAPARIARNGGGGPRPVWVAYAVEGLTTLGTSLLILGIFFYTTERLGWQPRHNLLLAATQGVAYTVAALCAQPLAHRLGRRGTLLLACAGSSAVALAGWLVGGAGPAVAGLLVAYTFATTLVWPVLESLVTAGADAHTMSRRLGVYNLTWSGVNVVGVALSGTIIQHFPAGVFLFPALAHAVAVGLLLARPDVDAPGASATSPDAAHAAAPEPELLRVRTLALWLSRIAMPATFMVIFGMMAILPTLPVMRQLDPAARTAVGSAWLATRWVAFLVLGMTAWWHTRPMSLLAATALMLVAFLGVTVPPSDAARLLFGAEASELPFAIDLGVLIAWQLVMGLIIALIYSSSLYFGMVLSDGSTEHGGYHEALIGLGEVIGPGSGAIAQWIWPGERWVSVLAVAGAIAMTVLVAGAAAVRARRRAG